MSKSHFTLKNEFLDYCKQFNYNMTEFPEELSRESEFFQNLSFEEKLKVISNLDKINTYFDITGYKWAIDLIKKTNIIQDDIINNVFCAEFPIKNFNARVIKSRNTYGYLIFLNKGMRNLIWNFSLAYSHYLLSKSENIIKDPFEVMLLYYLEKEPFQPIKYQYEQPSEEILKIAGNISSSLRLFIVAHEISHIQLRHTEKSIMSVEDEYEADELAIKIILEISRQSGQYILFNGGMISLVMLIIFDFFQKNIFDYSNNFPTEHPNNISRLKKIANQLDVICNRDELDFSTSFYITLMPLINFIKNATIKKNMHMFIIENGNQSFMI